MTTVGGGFDETAHDAGTSPPSTGHTPSGEPDWRAPWEPPAPPSAADYPPPPFPPPYAPIPAPAGYEQPPGYAGAPYPPQPPGVPPAGFGPPYPGGFYPAPNYPGGYERRSGTNGLAIASLISSFAGLICCVGSIVAIVLGTVALDQIKRTRQDGYGLAVAGIVVGIVTLVGSVLVAVYALHNR